MFKSNDKVDGCMGISIPNFYNSPTYCIRSLYLGLLKYNGYITVENNLITLVEVKKANTNGDSFDLYSYYTMDKNGLRAGRFK